MRIQEIIDQVVRDRKARGACSSYVKECGNCPPVNKKKVLLSNKIADNNINTILAGGKEI